MSGKMALSMRHPLRFGVGLPHILDPDVDPVAAAEHAEALGFDLVTHPDHLHRPYPTFEPWTLLAWVAARTSRVQVMPSVLALPYRAPAMLAKMAESFDRLSGGRLILGL